jgi:hypothetical protein
MKNLVFLVKNVFSLLSLVGLTVLSASCAELPGSITATQTATALQTHNIPSTLPSQATRVSSPPAGVDVQNIPFQSLTKGFSLGTSVPNPAIFLAFDNMGLESLNPLVSKTDASLISTVNLEKQTLLAVFWGGKSSGGYSITIDNVYISGDELIVEVLLQDNDPEFPKIEAATSPYHLVTVDKNLLTDIIMQYRMISHDVLLASGTVP